MRYLLVALSIAAAVIQAAASDIASRLDSLSADRSRCHMAEVLDLLLLR